MLKIINKDFFNGAILGFVSILIISSLSSINTINYFTDFYNDLMTMYEKDLIGQNRIQIARINLLYCDRELKHLMLEMGPENRDSAISNINGFKGTFYENISKAEPLYYRTDGKNLLIKLKEVQQDYFSFVEKTIQLYKSGLMKSDPPPAKAGGFYFG